MEIGERGRLQRDDEVQLRQLPSELHPGRHEAREGQGRARGGLRAHAGRAGVLRLDRVENVGVRVTP